MMREVSAGGRGALFGFSLSARTNTRRLQANEMSRIERKFQELERKGRAALVTYFTAGDPTLELTPDIVYKLEESGADMVELGVPFSDPMADGPAIQHSSERSLKNGTSLHDIIKCVAEIRKRSEIPILLFGYYNPFFAYGHRELARDAAEAGVDGLLIVDLPPEEAGDVKTAIEAEGCNKLDLVFLLAPTSTKERIELVGSSASGFIYLVSVTGVTGARPGMSYDLQTLVREIKAHSSLPVGVGFGVSTPEQAENISRFADAVIVGSAIVRIIEQHGNEKEPLLNELGAFVSELSSACGKGEKNGQ